MSRNKENVPITNHQRAKSAKVSLGATGHSDEFFTDSILESDVTRSSRIPTPNAHHPIQAKSRRARRSHKPSANTQPILRRASTSDNPASKSKDGSLQSAIHVRRSKSPGLMRSNTIATPPRSRINTDFASPHTDIKSPPPREFTDVYKQIADEEDLAATEGEFSDPEDSWPEDSGDEQVIVIQPQSHLQPQRSLSGARSRSSRASTPTQNGKESKKDIARNQVETMSDATGMSFLNDMTDQALAAKLTPHVSESARDRAKLREVWSNQKPVAFTKASKHSANGIFTNRDTIGLEPRIAAFTKATRAKPSGPYSDPASRPASQLSDSSTESHKIRTGPWDEDDSPLKPLPMNARVERNFHFTRRHGFPIHRAALTEQNLEQQNRGGRVDQADSAHPPSTNSHYSDPVVHPLHSLGARLNSGSDYTDRALKIRQMLLGDSKPKQTEDAGRGQTQIDWTAAAADVPLPAADSSSLSPGKEHVSMTNQKPDLSEKSRRWDLDFTGQSFQVSESPPVRNKQSVVDQSLGREIENLTKRAVTTNRLGEIREKHSQEQLRSHSRSPAPRSASRSSDRRRNSSHQSSNDQNDDAGEPLPNTPVVIIRSNSNGNMDKKLADHAVSAKSNSEDFLSRFARAVSNTPKASPASANGVQDHEIGPQTLSSKPVNRKSDSQMTLNEPLIAIGKPAHIVQTPKITGGWTDTILPDTVKTMKKDNVPAKYTQTPHVSAGGWVDTPAPQEIPKSIKEMTPIMEEVPEELINGIVRDKVDEEIKEPVKAVSPHAKVLSVQDAGQAKVGLAGILDRAKQRLISEDITTAARDNDTLNLGNETIESLQDLLALDEEECTVLSRVFNEEEGGFQHEGAQEEAVILGRINFKLDRLRSNIHEASKGISRLEHNISQPTSLPSSEDMHLTLCATCNRVYGTEWNHTHESKLLPTTPLHITLPLPMLFRTRPTSSPSKSRAFGMQIPQLTPLGYITFGIWFWYLIECTLSELYSHPTHAEYYVWPSSQLSEPEFPFVLPTMVSRWLKLNNLKAMTGFLFGWMFTFLRASVRVLGIWLGWTDGFFDSTSTINQVARAVTTTAAAAAGIETDMSMMNDEFI